jgi:hypothetical protein
VKDGAFVAERLPSLAFSFLAGTQSSEVLCCLGDDIVVQLEDYAAFFPVTDLDVEVDTWTPWQR